MAVSIPSDLVADVMRNADPARLAASRGRLMQQSPATVAPEFASLIERPSSKEASLERNAAHSDQLVAGRTAAYAGFEQMVLRNLFEVMMPKSDVTLSTEDPAADVWRSMAADKYAGAAADAGGIGIAKLLSERDVRGGVTTESDWPYFKLPNIQAFTS